MTQEPKQDVVADLRFGGAEEGIELIDEVEASFGIDLQDGETETCETMGEFHDLVLQRLRADGDSGDRCATAMAFYRLRQAVDLRFDEGVGPSTPLMNALDSSPRVLLRRAAVKTGLRMPLPVLGLIGVSGIALGIVGLIGSFVLASHYPLSFAPTLALLSASCMLAIASGYYDRGRYPSGMHTVGDLADYVAALNMGRLRDQGAKMRNGDIWRALSIIASETTGIAPQRIGPQSRFYPSR